MKIITNKIQPLDPYNFSVNDTTTHNTTTLTEALTEEGHFGSRYKIALNALLSSASSRGTYFVSGVLLMSHGKRKYSQGKPDGAAAE